MNTRVSKSYFLLTVRWRRHVKLLLFLYGEKIQTVQKHARHIFIGFKYWKPPSVVWATLDIACHKFQRAEQLLRTQIAFPSPTRHPQAPLSTNSLSNPVNVHDVVLRVVLGVVVCSEIVLNNTTSEYCKGVANINTKDRERCTHTRWSGIWRRKSCCCTQNNPNNNQPNTTP